MVATDLPPLPEDSGTPSEPLSEAPDSSFATVLGT